jgi:hypothetical protein
VWRLKKYVYPVAIFVVLIASGCSNSSTEDATSKSVQPSQQSGSNQTRQPDKVTQPPPPVKLLDLKYDGTSKSNIANAIKVAGFTKAFIPTKDATMDRLIASGVGPDLSLVLGYQYLRITETMDEPVFEHASVTPAILKTTNSGKWVTIQDNGQTRRFLLFERDSIYIKLEDFRNLSDRKVEAIADSFAPFSK